MKKATASLTGLIAAIGMLVPVLALAQAPAGETFSATATVKSPTKSATAPVTIRIDRFVSDAERDKMMAVIKAGDAAATTKALTAAADIGYIAVGDKRTPVKYAYARPTGDGRLITVVTAKPVLYIGGAAPDAKPKGQFDLALVLLVLDAQGAGDGEFSPAAHVRIDDKGAIVTEDYGKEVVRLTGVKRAK